MSQEKTLSKREQNKLQKRHALLDSSLNLFLEFGVETVTIDDIVKSAGVAKGSFYNYFNSKANLIEQLFKPFFAEISEVIENCDKELADVNNKEELFPVFETLGFALAILLFKNAGLTLLFLQECRGPEAPTRKVMRQAHDFIINKCYELTDRAHEFKLFKVPIDPQVSTLTVLGSVELLLLRFFQGKLQNIDPKTAVSNLIKLILGGLN